MTSKHSALAIASLVTCLGSLAGCEDSENTDVSGNLRQTDGDAAKIDPNAMPGQDDGLSRQSGP